MAIQAVDSARAAPELIVSCLPLAAYAAAFTFNRHAYKSGSVYPVGHVLAADTQGGAVFHEADVVVVELLRHLLRSPDRPGALSMPKPHSAHQAIAADKLMVQGGSDVHGDRQHQQLCHDAVNGARRQRIKVGRQTAHAIKHNGW